MDEELFDSNRPRYNRVFDTRTWQRSTRIGTFLAQDYIINAFSFQLLLQTFGRIFPSPISPWISFVLLFTSFAVIGLLVEHLIRPSTMRRRIGIYSGMLALFALLWTNRTPSLILATIIFVILLFFVTTGLMAMLIIRRNNLPARATPSEL